jgi:hypothetical protein
MQPSRITHFLYYQVVLHPLDPRLPPIGASWRDFPAWGGSWGLGTAPRGLGRVLSHFHQPELLESRGPVCIAAVLSPLQIYNDD